MKVAIIYPPISKEGKFSLLGQNRQFRYSSSNEVRIYPVVPATAATLLKENGFDVLWIDAINERLTMQEFLKRFYHFDPDMVVIETKTPVIKNHWGFINEIKNENDVLVALVGDHVSARPEKSFERSKVDYIITGGDYDLSLLKLARNLEFGTDLPKGLWYRDGDKIKNNGRFELVDELDDLPFIDRELTNWQLYCVAFLHSPSTYIMTGRGCGVGNCSFCSWQHSFWNCTARLRSPANVAEEIEMLVNNYKLKEIFDDNDSGAIWNKEWLREFHVEMKERGLIGEVFLSSNARADCLDRETCDLLKKSGFRLLLCGLESGNNSSLEKLNKGESIEQIKEGIKNAKDHGLRVLITTMTGYPWETINDVKQTYDTVRELMLYKTRVGDSLQSSFVIPYPGTPLYEEALEKDWFIIDPDDYEMYDMSQPVLKSHIKPLEWCNKLWSIHKEPKFVLKTLFSIRSFDDFKLLRDGLKSVLGHTKDF